jgi:hypothetical protein
MIYLSEVANFKSSQKNNRTIASLRRKTNLSFQNKINKVSNINRIGVVLK